MTEFIYNKSKCKTCNGTKRYKSTGACVNCAIKGRKAHYDDNKERQNELSKKWKRANTEKNTAKRKKWLAKNPGYEKDLRTRSFDRHFAYMCYRSDRSVTKEYLLEMLEAQGGVCALSGVTLTHSGDKCLTDASLDRIIHGKHGGEYTEGNVRLVCLAVNFMRWTMSDEELRWWCNEILS